MTENGKGGYLFIINPVSGKGKALEADAKIRSYCKKRRIRFSIHKTRESGEASEISKKGIACGFEAIIAVGGDGTVNEVGRELIGTNVPLGIIPTGSGNGLARHMGIPMGTRRAISRIFSGRSALIDSGRIADHVFLNVAGIGFDAQVSEAFAHSDRRGWYNYLRNIIRIGKEIKAMDVDIKTHSYERKLSCLMISFANSAQYGNRAKISPNADIADGKLDVCILKTIGSFQKFLFFLKMMTGTLKNSSHFEILKEKNVQITGGSGLAHADGDPIEIPEHFEVSIQPKSLYIIC